ncbi:MAG: pseudoazurin [Pseudomonadota bacterium]
MSTFINRRTFIAATSALALARPSFAQTTHEVQMLNKHPENRRLSMVYLPRVLVVQPGDTVSFVGVDRGHNSASVDDMIPEGAEAWDGKINDDISVTLETPGFYGYQCTPHASVGMVGLVIVEGEGMMDNLETAQGVRQRGKAKQSWEEIWEEVAGMEFATS